MVSFFPLNTKKGTLEIDNPLNTLGLVLTNPLSDLASLLASKPSLKPPSPFMP